METSQSSHLAGSREGAEPVYACRPQAFTENSKTQVAGYYPAKTSDKVPVQFLRLIQYLWLKAEKAMATHSGTLAWKIPWTEEPGGLQSMGSQRVGHD